VVATTPSRSTAVPNRRQWRRLGNEAHDVARRAEDGTFLPSRGFRRLPERGEACEGAGRATRAVDRRRHRPRSEASSGVDCSAADVARRGQDWRSDAGHRGRSVHSIRERAPADGLRGRRSVRAIQQRRFYASRRDLKNGQRPNASCRRRSRVDVPTSTVERAGRLRYLRISTA
jgi:hypothetical protein